MDLVPLYPKALYQSPSSPLHFLLDLRALYTSLSHDPFFPPIPSSPSSLAPPRIWTSSIPGVTLYYLLVSHISPYLVLPHVPLAT